MTIAGYHTAAELSDLLNSYAYQVAMLNGVAGGCVAWAESDPAAWAAWLADLKAASDAYDAGAAQASQLLQTYPRAIWGVTKAEDTFQALAQVFAPFIDLDRRLRVAAPCAPDYKDNPQPTSSDLDLSTYVITGKVLQQVGAGATTAGKTLILVAVVAGVLLVGVAAVKK